MTNNDISRIPNLTKTQFVHFNYHFCNLIMSTLLTDHDNLHYTHKNNLENHLLVSLKHFRPTLFKMPCWKCS